MIIRVLLFFIFLLPLYTQPVATDDAEPASEHYPRTALARDSHSPHRLIIIISGKTIIIAPWRVITECNESQ